MGVSFGGATFYFEKVIYIDESKVEAKDYVGNYYSEELQVEYQLLTKENKLFLSYPNNPFIKLSSGQKDEFGSGRRTRYVFQRNSQGIVTSFTVGAEGTVKDILFIKK